ERVLVEELADHRQVLPLALGIGEAKVDPLDLLVLDPLHDIRCTGHSRSSLLVPPRAGLAWYLSPPPDAGGGELLKSRLRPSRPCGYARRIRSSKRRFFRRRSVRSARRMRSLRRRPGPVHRRPPLQA